MVRNEFPMDKDLGNRILALRERIVSHFDAGDWEEIGLFNRGIRTSLVDTQGCFAASVGVTRITQATS